MAPNNPSMRQLLRIVESANPACQECGDRYDRELADEEHPELCIPCEDKRAGTSFDFDFNEDGKPYATMKDGPDKYLFRKDQKQKLVGSADNEPEDGEEELEETDMDKEIREMQIAAGIIVAENEAVEEETVDEEVVDEEESVDEGKLPDALKQHQFGKKDDDKDEEVDDKEEEVDDKDKEVIEEDCDESEDAAKNDDGECSPFTHADDNVDMVREDDFIEDLLLSPEGPKGPEVDEDDMVYGKTGKGKSYGPKDFDRFGDGDYPMDEGPDSDDPSATECPGCSDIAYRKIGSTDKFDEFECENCGAYGTHDRLSEQDPGEFDHDSDTLIDVGDEEDYKVYDFDSEFETMLGGSSDPVEGYGAGSMYEMNEIRRLAGMEPIEEKADKDYDGDGKVESEEDEYKGSKDKAIKKELDEERGGVVAYEIADEKAYYVMADLLGAEIDFGPEDEILVPAERNDQIVAALMSQGFEQDRDYRVAGQMMDDLQNGYNDRAFTIGQDYFPKGAQSTPASDLGPSASGLADNPMSNKMRMVKKNEVYENMKLAYRRHRKA